MLVYPLNYVSYSEADILIHSEMLYHVNAVLLPHAPNRGVGVDIVSLVPQPPPIGSSRIPRVCGA